MTLPQALGVWLMRVRYLPMFFLLVALGSQEVFFFEHNIWIVHLLECPHDTCKAGFKHRHCNYCVSGYFFLMSWWWVSWFSFLRWPPSFVPWEIYPLNDGISNSPNGAVALVASLPFMSRWRGKFSFYFCCKERCLQSHLCVKELAFFPSVSLSTFWIAKVVHSAWSLVFWTWLCIVLVFWRLQSTCYSVCTGGVVMVFAQFSASAKKLSVCLYILCFFKHLKFVVGVKFVLLLFQVSSNYLFPCLCLNFEKFKNGLRLELSKVTLILSCVHNLWSTGQILKYFYSGTLNITSLTFKYKLDEWITRRTC